MKIDKIENCKYPVLSVSNSKDRQLFDNFLRKSININRKDKPRINLLLIGTRHGLEPAIIKMLTNCAALKTPYYRDKLFFHEGLLYCGCPYWSHNELKQNIKNHMSSKYFDTPLYFETLKKFLDLDKFQIYGLETLSTTPYYLETRLKNTKHHNKKTTLWWSALTEKERQKIIINSEPDYAKINTWRLKKTNPLWAKFVNNHVRSDTLAILICGTTHIGYVPWLDLNIFKYRIQNHIDKELNYEHVVFEE